MSQKDDLISRQAALDAVFNNAEHPDKAYEAIRQLPSAQPETHEKRTETHACDLISRQAAIGALWKVKDERDSVYYTSAIYTAVETIEQLPPAQIEIIRCKDCKHSRFFDPCFYCYEFGGEIIVPENGFCFMAERRTDE